MAVGGFDISKDHFQSGQISGSNGDMGENNTAAFDPIFFFHHCNVDRMFWLWQKQNHHTDNLEILGNDYPGTNSSNSTAQGPTAGQSTNENLTLDTPLEPFLKNENDKQSFYTSKDCINIETQLGFTYSDGSLQASPLVVPRGLSTKKLSITGIDRSLFNGSFIIHAYAVIQDKEHTKYYLGRHSVLSRWDVNSCANCKTHLEVIAHFDLSNMSEDAVDDAEYHLDFQHRHSELPKGLAYEFKVID